MLSSSCKWYLGEKREGHDRFEVARAFYFGVLYQVVFLNMVIGPHVLPDDFYGHLRCEHTNDVGLLMVREQQNDKMSRICVRGRDRGGDSLDFHART